MQTKIVPVPTEFCFRDMMIYPNFNSTDFEYYFYLHYKDHENLSDRLYIPITYTGYHKKHNYGNDKAAINRLQYFVNGLDKSKKYFSIVQYDNGTLIDWTGIDIKIFSMSGGEEMNYPLPLIGQPYDVICHNCSKNYLANFMGRITHPIRDKVISAVMNKQGYYVSTHNYSVEDYCRIIAHSTFTLAPRGYGINSFRIGEAIRQGSIPVMISDEFIEPHNVPFETYGVKIKEDEISHIDEILRSFSAEEIKEKQNRLKDVFDTLYSFSGTRILILHNING